MVVKGFEVLTKMFWMVFVVEKINHHKFQQKLKSILLEETHHGCLRLSVYFVAEETSWLEDLSEKELKFLRSLLVL